MRHEYVRGFEDGVALCDTKVTDAKTLEEAKLAVARDKARLRGSP